LQTRQRLCRGRIGLETVLERLGRRLPQLGSSTDFRISSWSKARSGGVNPFFNCCSCVIHSSSNRGLVRSTNRMVMAATACNSNRYQPPNKRGTDASGPPPAHHGSPNPVAHAVGAAHQLTHHSFLCRIQRRSPRSGLARATERAATR